MASCYFLLESRKLEYLKEAGRPRNGPQDLWEPKFCFFPQVPLYHINRSLLLFLRPAYILIDLLKAVIRSHSNQFAVDQYEGEQADPLCTADILRKKFRCAKLVFALLALLGVFKQTRNTVATIPSSLRS